MRFGFFVQCSICIYFGLMALMTLGISCQKRDSCTRLKESLFIALVRQEVAGKYEIQKSNSSGGGLECSIWIPVHIRGRIGESSYEHHAVAITRFSDPELVDWTINGYRQSYPDKKKLFPLESPILATKIDMLATEGYVETVLFYKCGNDRIDYQISTGSVVPIRPLSGVVAAIKSLQTLRCPSEASDLPGRRAQS